MAKKLFVTKALGNKEIFSAVKLRKSMFDSGAPRKKIDEIIRKIQTHVKSGVSTSQIHRLAFQMLKSTSQTYAARYNLKKAIMHLGPDGFPFERYFAALLDHLGYTTTTNAIVQGKCITHEVDVIAEKHQENIHAIIEAKFHSRPGRKTGSKDALYTYGRFLDIQAAWVAKRKKGAKPAKGELQSWLVTNTEMTTNAINYCNCVGIKPVGWSYPNAQESLQGMIHHQGLYPITALVSLNRQQKRQLLRQNVIMCLDLLKKPQTLKKLHLSKNMIKKVLAEVEALCGSI